jgi:dihydrofolate reductase
MAPKFRAIARAGRPAVQQLKRESGKRLFVAGVKLPQALAELGLIDEYEFVVQPRLAGHGPTLFAGAIEACME